MVTLTITKDVAVVSYFLVYLEKGVRVCTHVHSSVGVGGVFVVGMSVIYRDWGMCTGKLLGTLWKFCGL